MIKIQSYLNILIKFAIGIAIMFTATLLFLPAFSPYYHINIKKDAYASNIKILQHNNNIYDIAYNDKNSICHTLSVESDDKIDVNKLSDYKVVTLNNNDTTSKLYTISKINNTIIGSCIYFVLGLIFFIVSIVNLLQNLSVKSFD